MAVLASVLHVRGDGAQAVCQASRSGRDVVQGLDDSVHVGWLWEGEHERRQDGVKRRGCCVRGERGVVRRNDALCDGVVERGGGLEEALQKSPHWLRSMHLVYVY
jgi:hypothetical protein